MITRSQIISWSTGQIFTIFFSPNDKYLFVDDRSGPLFPIPQNTLSWQPILGEICKMTFIRQAGVLKRIRIWQFWLKKMFNGNTVATSCANMVKIGSNPRDYEGNICTFFGRDSKNHHILPNISATTRPTFTEHSSLVDLYMKSKKLALVLQSLKGRCYGNQLILGAFFQT